MRYFAVLVLVVVAFGLVEADDSCPPNSKGKHPKCICNNDKPYDELNRICAITIEFKEVCPIGSEGVYPHCVCTEGKVYDAFRDACVNVDRSKCPQGSSNVNGKCICENVGDYKYEMDEIFWICRPWYIPTTSTTTSTTTIRPTYTTPQPRCPYHQSGEYPNCIWDPCPRGYFGDYWPHCTTCGNHQTGTPPNCYWLPCPEGWHSNNGTYPNCRQPTCEELGNCPITCPQYTRLVDRECLPIPCGPGTIGDFEPKCKLLPKCPSGYPGVWPNCNIYATTPANGKTPKTTLYTTPFTTVRTTTTINRLSTSTPGSTYLPPATTKPTTQKPTTYKPTTQVPTITPSARTPKTTEYTTSRKTTEYTTTRTTSFTTPSTTRTTTTELNSCSCQCKSDEIVTFIDGKEFNPSEASKKYRKTVVRKYRRTD